MPKIFEFEYKILRQYFLLIVDSFIEDEDYKNQWYRKITELDERIDRRREKAQINRQWNMKRTKRTKFTEFNDTLDFS